jgi:multicomponent K+:H+ antiporter subunit G
MNIFVGILVVLGALLALAGSLGLLTQRTFYERVHPPTMGATLGTGLILVACVVHFSDVQQRLQLHHLLIGVFMLISTPVTYMMLVRAALHRDAAEGTDHLASVRPSLVGKGMGEVVDEQPHLGKDVLAGGVKGVDTQLE